MVEHQNIYVKILILIKEIHLNLNFSTPNTNLCSSLPISIKNVNNKEAFKNAVKEFF
jgi:hypothetical protein